MSTAIKFTFSHPEIHQERSVGAEAENKKVHKKFADSKILCTFVHSFIGVGFIIAVVAQW